MRKLFIWKTPHHISKKAARAWRAGFSESGAFDSLLLIIMDRIICGFYTLTILPLLNNSFSEKGLLIFRTIFLRMQGLSGRGKLRIPMWLLLSIIQLMMLIITLVVVFFWLTIIG